MNETEFLKRIYREREKELFSLMNATNDLTYSQVPKKSKDYILNMLEQEMSKTIEALASIKKKIKEV